MTRTTRHVPDLLAGDQATSSGDQILSPKQVSEELQIPVKTIYAWRYQGTGPPSFRAGKHLRFRRSDITSWVQAQIAADKHGAA